MGASFSPDPSCQSALSPEIATLIDAYQSAHSGSESLTTSDIARVEVFLESSGKENSGAPDGAAIQLSVLRVIREPKGALHLFCDLSEAGSARCLYPMDNHDLIGLPAGMRCVAVFELPPIESADTVADELAPGDVEAKLHVLAPSRLLEAELVRFKRGDLEGVLGSHAKHLARAFRDASLHLDTTRVSRGDFDGRPSVAVRFNDLLGGAFAFALGVSSYDGSVIPSYGMCFPYEGCATLLQNACSEVRLKDITQFDLFFHGARFAPMAEWGEDVPLDALQSAAHQLVVTHLGDPGDSWSVALLGGVRSVRNPDRYVLQVGVRKQNSHSLLPSCDGETLTRSELPTALLIEVTVGDIPSFSLIGFCVPSAVLGEDLNTLCTRPHHSLFGNAIYDVVTEDLRSRRLLPKDTELPTEQISHRAIQLGVTEHSELFAVLVATPYGDHIVQILRHLGSGIVRLTPQEGMAAAGHAADISVMAFFPAESPEL